VCEMSAWDGGPPRSAMLAADLSALREASHVGAKLKLRTLLGEDVAGELFAYDKVTGMLVIQEKGESKGNMRLLKANSIKEVEILEKLAEPAELKLPAVDLRRLQAREAAALKAAEDEAKRIGVGVSELAQDIFDALSKTLPCRWDAKRIVVLDEVHIEEPYTTEACKGANAMAVDRVRKVLDGERARKERPTAVGAK